jgi:methyl-accepting chemotaxis protein WspA
MQWFKDRKIATKLRLGFGVMLLIIIGIGVLSYGTMRQVGMDMRKSYEHGAVPIAEAAALQKESYELRLAMLGFMRSLGDPAAMAEFEAAALKQEEAITRVGEQMAMRANTPEERILLDEWRDHWATCIMAHREVLRLGNVGDKDHAWQVLLGTGEYGARFGDHFKMPLELAARLAELKRQQTMSLAEGSYQMLTRTTTVIAGSLVGAFALALVLSFAMPRSIARPLRQLERAAAEIAQGHLDTVIATRSHDEIGWLAQAFNGMRLSLAQLLAAVQQSGIQVTSSATQMAASSKQLDAMMTEQVTSTHEVVATAAKIAANGQELVMTMQEVAGVAEDTATAAASGHNSLARMEATMQQLEAATRTLTERLAVLHDRAAAITAVITTITKVADQTNLLSLNAAIEAEKAGEYGRGFAVVAREIRRLADQTAVATLDIERIVKEMTTAVSVGVEGMAQFAHEVREGAEVIRTVSTQLTQIIRQVQALTPRFEVVHAGMQAQAQGAQQISEAMSQVSEAAHQTAAALDASTEAITQLHELSQGLHERLARFHNGHTQDS